MPEQRGRAPVAGELVVIGRPPLRLLDRRAPSRRPAREIAPMSAPKTVRIRRSRSLTSHTSTASRPAVAVPSARSSSPGSGAAARSSSTARRWAPRQAGLATPYLRRMRATRSDGAYSSLFSTKNGSPFGGSTRMSAWRSGASVTSRSMETSDGAQPPVAAHSKRQRSAQISSTKEPSSLSNRAVGAIDVGEGQPVSGRTPARGRGRRRTVRAWRGTGRSAPSCAWPARDGTAGAARGRPGR